MHDARARLTMAAGAMFQFTGDHPREALLTPTASRSGADRCR